MISDFSLFDINLPQLQQLYTAQTKSQSLSVKDFQTFCQALEIMPELLGQEMLRKLVARVTGTCSLSKTSISFPEFLEILKQIAISSFSSAPSLKEKCRRFFAHISARSKDRYCVVFKLKKLKSKTKLTKIKDTHFSPVRSPKTNKLTAFDKRHLAIPAKDADKEVVNITINLGDKKPTRVSNQTPDLKIHRTVSLKPEETYKDILRTYSEKLNRKKSLKKLKRRKTEKLKVVPNKMKKEFVILKEKFDLKKKYQNLLKAHRLYRRNTSRKLFRTDFVKKIIFKAWKHLRIN